MVQLITFLLVVAALVVLVLQNLTPVLELVVLGGTTVALPLAVWLLSAIALGALCAWLIYQLVPQKRAYRPIGKRLTDPVPESPPTNRSTNRFVDSPEDSSSGQPPSQPASSRDAQSQSPYDSDWENFRAPEQWDDWGQQQASGYRDRPRTSAEDTVRDIESGWGDDGYSESARAAARQTNRPDSGDRAQGGAEQPSSSTYEPRTYEEGWLYGSDAPEEPAPEPNAPLPEESEDVYDANYRVIIPPYDTQDKDG